MWLVRKPKNSAVINIMASTSKNTACRVLSTSIMPSARRGSAPPHRPILQNNVKKWVTSLFLKRRQPLFSPLPKKWNVFSHISNSKFFSTQFARLRGAHWRLAKSSCKLRRPRTLTHRAMQTKFHSAIQKPSKLKRYYQGPCVCFLNLVRRAYISNVYVQDRMNVIWCFGQQSPVTEIKTKMRYSNCPQR